MDRIILHGVEFRGHHGVTPEEQQTGGHYSVDLEVEADLAPSASSDDVSDTVNYGELHRIVREIGEGERHRLLESLAARMADSILRLQGVQGVRLRICKHRPPLPGVVAYSAVEIERRLEQSEPQGS